MAFRVRVGAVSDHLSKHTNFQGQNEEFCGANVERGDCS